MLAKIFCATLILLLPALPAWAENQVTSGKLVVDAPTLTAIGASELTLEFAWNDSPSTPPPYSLIVGLPRPQTARVHRSRTHAASRRRRTSSVRSTSTMTRFA